MACLNVARDNSLLVAVRAGGHNVAGYAVCNGGLMIDLSLMNGVRLDPQLDRAYVEGGATWATSTPQPHHSAVRHRVG
jgi:FAD/FMN-containing dehydrogenase